MPETPLNAWFLSLKHSSLGSRALPQTRCGTSQIVIQGCLSMTGRRNESQVSGMILIMHPSGSVYGLEFPTVDILNQRPDNGRQVRRSSGST
jgi:hypothetical protein